MSSFGTTYSNVVTPGLLLFNLANYYNSSLKQPKYKYSKHKKVINHSKK